ARPARLRALASALQILQVPRALAGEAMAQDAHLHRGFRGPRRWQGAGAEWQRGPHEPPPAGAVRHRRRAGAVLADRPREGAWLARGDRSSRPDADALVAPYNGHDAAAQGGGDVHVHEHVYVHVHVLVNVPGFSALDTRRSAP